MGYNDIPERDMEPPDGGPGFEIWCEKLDGEFFDQVGVDLDEAYPDLDREDWFTCREYGAYNLAEELADQWKAEQKRYAEWMRQVEIEVKRLSGRNLADLDLTWLDEYYTEGDKPEDVAEMLLDE